MPVVPVEVTLNSLETIVVSTRGEMSIGAAVQSKETEPRHKPVCVEETSILPIATLPGNDVVMPPASILMN